MIKIRASTAARSLGVLAVGALTLMTALSGWKPASAVSEGALTFTPSVLTVASGGNFTVAVMQTSTSTSSGAQADLVFDRTKLQITDVVRGTAYSAPPSGAAIGFGDLDVPPAKANAIAAANTSTGVLSNVAVFYATTGGQPTIPAGTSQAFVISMHALTGISRVATALNLANGEMLDAAGNAMLTSVLDSGGLSLSTSTANVMSGNTFTVSIVQNSLMPTSGVQADLMFDRSKAAVTDVARGAAYSSPPSGASVGLGDLDVPPAKANAMAAANGTTGVLQNISVYYATNGGQPVIAAGSTTSVVVTFQALVNITGTVSLFGLSQSEMLNADGTSMLVDIPRNHRIDPNGDGYSAADEVTAANCNIAACTGITTFGTAETRTCKDAARVCGTPFAVVDELSPARVAVPPATGYGCSVTLDTTSALKTTKLAQSDVDLDGTVSILDLSKVASWFGQAVNPDPSDPRWEGNMDGDGSISILDLSAMAANFGRSVANNCKVE